MSDYAHGKKLDRLETAVVELKGEVQRLEEAHAALNAKVDELEDRETSNNIMVNQRIRDLTKYTNDRFRALEPPATPAPEIVQCPVCGAMVDESTLITGVWEGEPQCNCPTVYDKIAAPIEKTVECTKCGHPVWFIAGENDPHPCTDCGAVNSREQPDIFAAEPMLNPISFTDGELAVIEYVLTNAKASATGTVGEDIRKTLHRVRSVRSGEATP